MFKYIEHWFKTFLTLNKSEQRGILILLILLVLILVFNIFLPRLSHSTAHTDTQFQQEVERFVTAQKTLEDSLELIRLQQVGKLTYSQAVKRLKPFAFDPNSLSLKQWEQMGLSARQANSILNYRAKGGLFRKKSDLKKIYKLSAVEYRVLEPFIQINKAVQHFIEMKLPHAPSSHKAKVFKSLEINHADSKALINTFKLSPWLARRIIKYRKLLGGFYCKEQLKEVYGLQADIYNKIAPYITVDSNHLQRFNLNGVTFKTLLHHPYFNYKTTQELFKTRLKLHGFDNLNQLKTQGGIPDSVFNKIRYYLYIRPFKN